MNPEKMTGPKNVHEPEVASTRADLSINAFNKYLDKEQIDRGTLTEESIREIFALKKDFRIPGVTVEDVVPELKKRGYIQEKPIGKVAAPKPAPEYIPTEYVHIEGLKKIEDENIKKQIEQNLAYEELETYIFKKGKGFTSTYEKIMGLRKENTIEKPEYYFAFAEAGLIKGGKEEVARDLQKLQERKEDFKKKEATLTEEEVSKNEKAKQIASMLETGVAYAVTELEWYGENVSIEQTSEFDDIKRRTDIMLEIRKEGDKSKFLGLGIDVTYRGLESIEYKEKYFIQLNSISDGFVSRVKYHKNHKGEMMKEFAAPKVILFLDIKDVRHLIHSLKHIDEPGVKEELKNSSLRITAMKQMIASCRKLAKFAEEANNPISKEYDTFLETVSTLAVKYPEFEEILNPEYEDQVTRHIDSLIEEFKIERGK